MIPLLEQLADVEDVRKYIPNLKIGDFLKHYSIKEMKEHSQFEQEYHSSNSMGLHHHLHYLRREELLRHSGGLSYPVREVRPTTDIPSRYPMQPSIMAYYTP